MTGDGLCPQGREDWREKRFWGEAMDKSVRWREGRLEVVVLAVLVLEAMEAALSVGSSSESSEDSDREGTVESDLRRSQISWPAFSRFIVDLEVALVAMWYRRLQFMTTTQHCLLSLLYLEDMSSTKKIYFCSRLSLSL